MNISTRSWSPQQRSLICLIEKSPIACLPHSNKRKKNVTMDGVWKDIASKLDLSPRICKLHWTKIKLSYAKIMILIKTGKITKQDAMYHPKTRKFFQGLLSFLDPYISNITDEDIPFLIHRSINYIFGLETKHRKNQIDEENNSQFFTHSQVKELLTERTIRGDVVNDIDTEYLLTVVDMAIDCKLGELLLMQNSSSNNIANNNDDENTVNLTMMPSKNLQIVHKRNPSCTQIPRNNNEENTSTTTNLGLQSELILDDDIKTEEEEDINMENEDFVYSQEDNFVDLQEEHSIISINTNNQNEEHVEMKKLVNSKNKQYVDTKTEIFVNSQNEQYVDMKEDFLKELNSTLEKNINNTTEINYDIESSLPGSQILSVGYDKKNKTLKVLCENANVSEDTTDNMTDTLPVTDAYIRNFFNELGVVMSVELSLDKQKILKSRINELVKRTLLQEMGQASEM